MSLATVLTMADGNGVDLLAVKAVDISFKTLAEHVAKEKRFNGATPGVEYSVGQHLCLGSDAILNDGGTELDAAYFLIHDLKEGLWKDDPTPKKKAIAERIAQSCGVTADRILGVLDELEDGIDAAIHQAAGLRFPLPIENQRIVKLYDVKMLLTEWRELMGDIVLPNRLAYDCAGALDIAIEPWHWTEARDQLLYRARKLIPTMRLRQTKAPMCNEPA